MENTGRIRKFLTPVARRILLPPIGQGSGEEELRQMTRVDQAHLLMLMERGIVDEIRATRLLTSIERLRQADFSPLWERNAPRGLFLAYEDFLIETEGAQTGGILQTARSRNDLNATVFKLKLRAPYIRLLHESLRLVAVLLRRSRKYAHVTMPVYTHGQAAMPGTYGYYLAGVASALLRDCKGLFEAGSELQASPLGAGAVAGTSFPIDASRTAALLGFTRVPLNSLDAVASRDLVLRITAAAAILAITLSRLATDFVQWTTTEFNFLLLPDELVGSSSAMPQKRNPFLLEHVQGRAGALVGAFTQAATSMHGAPFTNSISVGTEAVKPQWDALQNAIEMLVLMRLLAAHAVPNREAMLRRAAEGFTTATELANCLVRQGNLDFRSAHHMVGEVVAAAHRRGSHGFDRPALEELESHGVHASFSGFQPEAAVRSLEWGGGPGPESIHHCLNELQKLWRGLRRKKISWQKQWQNAEARLREEVQRRTAVCDPSPAIAEFQNL